MNRNEDTMGLKLCAAALCAAVIAVTAIASPPAEAAAKKKRVVRNQSVVLTTRPAARITVRNRSFLDAGTDSIPGDRKFTDYAFPPNSSPIGVLDNSSRYNRGSLPGPFDLPGRSNPWPWHWCSGC
jgi:hypothetical protein